MTARQARCACGHKLGRGNTSGLCRRCFGQRLWSPEELAPRVGRLPIPGLARLLATIDRQRLHAALDQLDTAGGP